MVNLSQPAFSAFIAALEQEVGFRLFDRDTRKVQINIDGLHFIKLARSLISSYDNTIREIKRYSSGEEGSVTIAVLPSLAVKWLLQMIAKFNEENPC